MINHKGTLTLKSERLILRALTLNDAQAVFDNWASDHQVTQFLRWNTHEDTEVTKKWLADNESRYPNPTFYEWGIVLRATGELIGTIGVMAPDDEPNRYELGYCIGRAFWNQGITTEALIRIIGYLSDEVGIKSFIARHAKENPASGKVMMRAGFRYVKDGTYKSFDGQREYDCKIYHLNII